MSERVAKPTNRTDDRAASPTAKTFSLYLDADLNRVFTESLTEIAAAELRIVADALGSHLGGSVGDIERISEGRSRRLRFTASCPAETLTTIVGQLSASTQLFVHDHDDLLRPIPTQESLVFGSELVTTQRYRGKTNERLTRTMVNAALATAGIDPTAAASMDPDGPPATRPTLLDPMCGRGTTLNWALAYGLHTVGIDVERSALDHHATFLQTWAKRSRLPHKMLRHKPGNGDLRATTFEVAPDRVRFKSGAGQRLETFHADAGDPSPPIRKRSVDVIVADLPYGIQHRGSADASDRRDSPETEEPLQRVLGTWERWLKPTGAICLAWNTKRASRRSVGSVLAEAGYVPITAPGGYSMRHVVDATIDRDVIVAARR